MKCDGLTSEQLSRRSVPRSTLSLLGLVRHLAEVERSWTRRVMRGEEAPRLSGEPGRDTVFLLEHKLDLAAGRLSRDLGYLPPDPLDNPDVVAAIDADPRLSDQAKVMLVALYRSAVLSSADSAASVSATRRTRDRRS